MAASQVARDAAFKAFDEAAASAQRAFAAIASTWRTGLGPHVLLVVDDEPAARTGLLRLLRDEGYDVETAADGTEALAIAQARFVDLAIVDLHMPGMSGMALIRALRTASLKPLAPIIVVSGVGEEGAVLAQEAGANAWLPKPCDVDALCRLVSGLLERR